MPIQFNEENGGKILVVHISGMLTKADYEYFIPEFDRLVLQHSKLRVLFDMTGFQGWTVDAVWEDTKFGQHFPCGEWSALDSVWEDTKFTRQHLHDIDRLAMVGEKKWHEGMAAFCKPFTKATIQFFDAGSDTEARKWLGEA